MTVLPWQPGQTPYVTPDQLYSQQGSIVATQWPVGVQFGTIPGLGTGGSVSASQANSVIGMLCKQATTRAEGICNQVLRSVVQTDELAGPDRRLTVQQDEHNARFTCSRWPVVQVISVQVCPNDVWPRQWTPVPAGNFEPEFPVPGLHGTSAPSGAGEGGQTVLIAPGWINRCLGRYGWRMQVRYIAGWPHTCLTATAAPATLVQTITVDDCTGWFIPSAAGSGATGAAGVIYDAVGGGLETFTCTGASAAAGPGTLTLASELAYSHAPGIMVSAMPESIIWATALLAGDAALMRGATSTTVQTTSPRTGKAARPLVAEAKEMLCKFAVTV